MTKTAVIGFRTKTGKAVAIAISGGPSPTYVQRWEIELWDHSIPETGQPHHEVMELPWADAQVAVRRFENIIHDLATTRLRAVAAELRQAGFRADGVGVVGSPDRALEKLGNRHMRAHAAEGMLYRRAMEVAAERCQLRVLNFSDRTLGEIAPGQLHITPEHMKRVLTEIGRAAGRPWRTDERAAATAAWLVLAK